MFEHVRIPRRAALELVATAGLAAKWPTDQLPHEDDRKTFRGISRHYMCEYTFARPKASAPDHFTIMARAAKITRNGDRLTFYFSDAFADDDALSPACGPLYVHSMQAEETVATTIPPWRYGTQFSLSDVERVPYSAEPRPQGSVGRETRATSSQSPAVSAFNQIEQVFADRVNRLMCAERLACVRGLRMSCVVTHS